MKLHFNLQTIMKTKILFTLFLVSFSVLTVNNCYSQGAIGKSAKEITAAVEYSGSKNPYHVEYSNGKIEYVVVFYPDELLTGVAWTNIYRYYVMKNGVCDYILDAYDKISMNQLKQYYDTYYIKEGNFYRSNDLHPFVVDELYELIFFDNKATVKVTLQKRSSNEEKRKIDDKHSQSSPTSLKTPSYISQEAWDDRINLETFIPSEVPEEVTGCNCEFSVNKEEFKKGNLIFVSGLEQIAYVKSKEEMVDFWLLDENDGAHIGFFEKGDRVEFGSGFNKIIIEIDDIVWEGYESTRMIGTLKLIDVEGKVITKKIYGSCGC